MGYYFEDHRSLFASAGMQAQHTLECILKRYVAQNPPHPVTFRAYSNRGIQRDKDYRYRADFNRFFPRAENEQFAYAWAKMWAASPAPFMFDVTCFGPMVIHCNGPVVWKSDIFTERYDDARQRVTIALQAGWNHFVIRYQKTRAGFGGIFGSWLGKHPYRLMMPTPEREGQEGWLFTKPMAAELATLPGPETSEQNSNLRWHPMRTWNKAKLRLGQINRIYAGVAAEAYVVGWTRVYFLRTSTYVLKGKHQAPITVLIDDRAVFSAPGSGRLDATIRVSSGHHDVMVRCDCSGSDPGFEISIHDGQVSVPFSSPCDLAGTSQPWVYTGPFKASRKLDLKQLRDLHRVLPGVAGDTYWRVDLPETWVRIYNENPLYGQWSYPLGVILYGLLQAALAIDSTEIQQYVVSHVQLCCNTFRYALWDRDQFGGATNVHHLLASIDSLDDCGSFGSAMLEVARHFDLKGCREIADYVANYISNKQARLPDGAFFRKKLMHVFHENTLWADDLYMSVPFLCRYYQLTGDRKYINDAARQFVGFKQRLFIPELKVMSHVYDLRRELATGVPWGRGNGWTLFALSELLAVLPQNHAHRPALLTMFRELCEGILALQDESGMWHQVLTHRDSYPETSCTAMFICGFARGIRFGWLKRQARYVRAVRHAWEALNRISIDQEGNVHGVCRGSEFSFSPEYYKNELLWNLNDTHGIGIVLLAGVAVLKLMAHLKADPKPTKS